MKRIYLFLIVIAGSWLMSSCSDIVDSESNKRITILEYSSIKADQEHDVIMPLKTGNKWYYNVTEFNPAGTIQTQYLDSIEVVNEISLDGERWFEVNFPPMGPVYMANTNLGLWIKCKNCTDVSYLEAKYPDINNTFYSGYILGDFLTDTNGHGQIVSDSVIIWKKSDTEHLIISDSSFDCIKYTGWLEGTKLSISELPYCNNWYVPNFGLVRYDKLQTTPSGVSKSYVWIQKPKLASTELTQYIYDLDFKTVKQNMIKDTTVMFLLNETNEACIIYSITISGADSENFSLSALFPIKISPSENVNFTARFAPVSIGNKTAQMAIHTSMGDYTVSVHGISQ